MSILKIRDTFCESKKFCLDPSGAQLRTREKDEEVLTQVEDIPIFNFVRMQEPISSLKYHDKTTQTKTLKTKFAILWGGFN